MKKTQHGMALKEYLDEEYEKISDITTCLTWEETLGRKESIKILRKLFSFIDVENRSVDKVKSQYT